MRQLFNILKQKETEIYRPRFFYYSQSSNKIFLHTRCNAQETPSVKVHIFRHYYISHTDDAFIVIFWEFWSQNTVSSKSKGLAKSLSGTRT